MKKIFRIGVLMTALLIAMTGCGSIEWLRGSLGAKEDGRVSAKSDEAVGQPAQAESQAAPVAANSNARSQVGTVHVLFAFDRSDLNKAAQTDLVSLIKKLRENPKFTVGLEGYADSAGARDYNLQLSQKRVEAVRRYLVEKGVEASRIRSDSLGQIADGGTQEERAKNRRVTIKLLGAE